MTRTLTPATMVSAWWIWYWDRHRAVIWMSAVYFSKIIFNIFRNSIDLHMAAMLCLVIGTLTCACKLVTALIVVPNRSISSIPCRMEHIFWCRSSIFSSLVVCVDAWRCTFSNWERIFRIHVATYGKPKEKNIIWNIGKGQTYLYLPACNRFAYLLTIVGISFAAIVAARAPYTWQTFYRQPRVFLPTMCFRSDTKMHRPTTSDSQSAAHKQTEIKRDRIDQFDFHFNRLARVITFVLHSTIEPNSFWSKLPNKLWYKIAMAFSFSTDFDGSTTESAIIFSNESPNENDVVCIVEIFIRIVATLVDGFAVAAKWLWTSWRAFRKYNKNWLLNNATACTAMWLRFWNVVSIKICKRNKWQNYLLLVVVWLLSSVTTSPEINHPKIDNQSFVAHYSTQQCPRNWIVGPRWICVNCARPTQWLLRSVTTAHAIDHFSTHYRILRWAPLPRPNNSAPSACDSNTLKMTNEKKRKERKTCPPVNGISQQLLTWKCNDELFTLM